MSALPKRYEFLAREPAPRILLEALKLYGTLEVPGPKSNPLILQWAKSTGLDRIYRDDSTSWCGLFMAYVALQAGWQPPINPLGARNWLNFGTPQKEAALGDVLVYWRGSRNGWLGHVGIYVGEDKENYFTLGGNQKDRVSIEPKAKDRILGIRRCPWNINQPANVRPIWLTSAGPATTAEA